MRWLMLKDLQILRRSPLLVGLLVVYPVILALLIGFALSRSPDRPKVAFVNEVAAGQGRITFGNETIDASKYADAFFDAVDPVRVSTRAEAIEKVKQGKALAALVVPADIVSKLSSGVEPARVEVIYNGDALKQNLVESTIDSQLAKANQALSDKLKDVAIEDVSLIFDGGTITTPIGDFDLLGLNAAKPILAHAIAALPANSPDRAALARVQRFAALAGEGLGIAKAGLGTVSKPVLVTRTIIGGKRTPLDGFGAAAAVAVCLLFTCSILAAGMLAVEREEQAFGRLVRGLVSKSGLVAEKIGLSALCSFPVGLLMLALLAVVVGIPAGRVALWVPATLGASLGFAAFGVALGAAAREVRVSSLLAVLVGLPLVFLALVPQGAVAGWLYDIIRVANALFPFKASLQAVDAAVNDAQPGLGTSLAHLAAITAGYGALARLALQRF